LLGLDGLKLTMGFDFSPISNKKWLHLNINLFLIMQV
jgi:hypothetical protein